MFLYSADFPENLKVEYSDVEEIFLVNDEKRWS
jgi:hypothetical protein